MKEGSSKYTSDTQLLLARLYRIVTLVGFAFIAVGFVVYIADLLPAHMPVDQVASYWHLSAQDYAAQTGTPYGWNLLKSIASGDMIGLASLVFMALSVIVCLLIMAFALLRNKNRLFAIAALVQSTILILAASGIVSGH